MKWYKKVQIYRFRFGTTLTSTINFMTRGFDDLTLTFYKTKP